MVVLVTGASAGACWGGTIGAGWVKGVAGTPASAWLMNCCQVIAGHVPPNTWQTPLTHPMEVAWLRAFPIHTAADRVGV
jgi:hypothetical protein